MIGFAICGSFCNRNNTLATLQNLMDNGYEVLPIISENTATTDTRFGRADDFIRRVMEISHKEPILNINQAETISNTNKLEGLVVCPCTGNTLGKIANGITDTSVTMAVKAHIRNRGWVVIALASNDGLSSSFTNLAKLYDRKCFYFVPICQDDSDKKPTSLVCNFDLVGEAVEAAKKAVQLQPFLF